MKFNIIHSLLVRLVRMRNLYRWVDRFPLSAERTKRTKLLRLLRSGNDFNHRVARNSHLSPATGLSQ